MGVSQERSGMIPQKCKRLAEEVQHCWLNVDAMTRPMQIREEQAPYGG